MSKFIDLSVKGALGDESKWFEYIGGIKAAHAGFVDYDGAKVELRKVLVSAIEKRIPEHHFGIFFSGGVDSSFIAQVCKNKNANFTCYTVGFSDKNMAIPPDIIYSRKVAKDLDLNYVEKIYNEDEAEKIIEEVVKILPKPKEFGIDFFVKVGVGSVILAAKKLADDSVFFSGLGSEEIFAGYQRHSEANDVDDECWNGLKMMWRRDILRDVSIANAAGIDFRLPFLDEDVIKSAMEISSDHKINDEFKKIVLREIAELEGLSHEFAWRKKQGAQYGSKFDKAIARIAKKKGFKLKKDYLRNLVD